MKQRILSKLGGGGLNPPLQNSGSVATPPPCLAPLKSDIHRQVICPVLEMYFVLQPVCPCYAVL